MYCCPDFKEILKRKYFSNNFPTETRNLYVNISNATHLLQIQNVIQKLNDVFDVCGISVMNRRTR